MRCVGLFFLYLCCPDETIAIKGDPETLKDYLSESAQIVSVNKCYHSEQQLFPCISYIVHTIYIYKSSWKVFALCFCFRLPNQKLTYINNKFNFGCNRKKDNNKNKNT